MNESVNKWKRKWRYEWYLKWRNKWNWKWRDEWKCKWIYEFNRKLMNGRRWTLILTGNKEIYENLTECMNLTEH
jgi:hypothetical protein